MFAILAALIAPTPQTMPPHEVRVMIHDARRIVRKEGEQLWQGFSQAPLPVQLVEAEREVLFCSRRIRSFRPLGFDPVTRCPMQIRPRELPADITAATYLADQSVIQIGLPGALNATRAEWIIILLHESFHQYQAALPGYQDAVDQMGRSLGQSGAGWMLDYNFPYAKPQVSNAITKMNKRALAFLAARSEQDVMRAVENYVLAREAARTVVGAKDWQYYEFQVGQEGVARWSELKLANAAGRTNREIASAATDRQLGLATSLHAMNRQGLGTWKRSSFYVLGALEADMLERIKPGWREDYRRAPFSLGALLRSAVASQGR